MVPFFLQNSYGVTRNLFKVFESIEYKLKNKRMKKYLNIVVVLLLALIACDDNEILDINQEIIFGEWKLTETSFSVGGSDQITRDVEDGFEFVFLEDNSFTSTQYEECSAGEYTFNLEENKLFLNYNCSSFSSNSMNENGEIIYSINFNNNNQFSIARITGAICAEGCSSKFTRE